MAQLIEITEQAVLALAAYADLAGKLTIDSSDQQELVRSGMSTAQAERFAVIWRVVDRYSDTSGISATVFEEVASGRRHLAIRGTEPGLSDINADYILTLGFPSYLNPKFVRLRSQVESWLSNGTLTPGFTAAGHSLGGYLAAAVNTWFRSGSSDAYMFNAPGVGGPIGNVFDAFKSVFGLGEAALVAGIHNVRGTAGISLIAGFGAQLAPSTLIWLIPVNRHERFRTPWERGVWSNPTARQGTRRGH